MADHSWTVDRESESHYIHRKARHGSIPVVVHGGSIARKYAKLVLRQTGIPIVGTDLENDMEDFRGGPSIGIGDRSEIDRPETFTFKARGKPHRCHPRVSTPMSWNSPKNIKDLVSKSKLHMAPGKEASKYYTGELSAERER